MSQTDGGHCKRVMWSTENTLSLRASIVSASGQSKMVMYSPQSTLILRASIISESGQSQKVMYSLQNALEHYYTGHFEYADLQTLLKSVSNIAGLIGC